MATARAKTLEELRHVAAEVLASVSLKKGSAVIALSGDLGAGKTAFVKELAHHLGVKEEITSPTFVIMRSYPIPAHPQFNTLTHIDAYRIESEEELKVLRIEELLLDPARIICIEWPERAKGLIPEDAYPVSLAIEEGGVRTISHGK